MHERSRDDERPTADTTSRSSRNDVAYSKVGATPNTVVRRRSGISDSKHTSAATLAVDLASSSSWSDAILSPGSYIEHSDFNNTPTSLQQASQSLNDNITGYPVLEPPPEYSPYQEREVASEFSSSANDSMRYPVRRSEMSEATHISHSFGESDHEYGADAPLLEQPSNKKANNRYPWRSKDKDKCRGPNFRQRLIVACILLVFMIGAVAGYLRFSRHEVKQWRSLPLIQTNQSHIRHSTYDHITGCFELHERLELSTTTGAIDIQIDPQPSSGYNNTSTLILKSSTGKITLGISEKWFMRREKIFPTIHTEIKSLTGTVYARILLGSGGSAIISTISGSQDIRVYAYSVSAGDPISRLSTTSHIGDQVVALTNFGGWDTTIDALQAEHRSQGTAKIDLQYSKHWRGRVHARATPVGRVEVQGDVGLVFDQQGEHEVIAHKGKSDHLKDIDAISEGTGDVVFKSWYTW